MTEPHFSINFTANMIAAEACAVGDLLVYDAATGWWKVSSAANRATADARTQAVALTAYGGSAVGKVSYQAAGTVAAEVSDLADGADDPQFVRASSAGRFERIATASIDPDTDDLVGYAEKDGRVHLFVGLPYAELVTIVAGLSVTGTGFVHATSGVIDPAATALARYASGKVQIDGNLQFRNTGDSNRTLDLVATPTSTNKTLTLPNATDQVVARDTTDTLTNKTLTSPIINGLPVYRVTGLDIPSYVTPVATAATTQVNCGTVTLADETTAAIDVIVRCSRDGSNTKRGVWKFSAVVSRNGAGAVLDVLNVGEAFNLNGGTVTCDVDSNSFRVRITPADTDARKWDSEIRVQVNT